MSGRRSGRSQTRVSAYWCSIGEGMARVRPAEGEDFLRDGEDIAELMGDRAHLVGHSYSGLGAMVAAARRPDATLSLVLLEPAAFAMGQDNPAGTSLVEGVRLTGCADGRWAGRR